MCVQTHGNIQTHANMCVQTHGNINVCTNSW